MKKLSVHLVTWNGAKYVPYLFASLKKQTYTDWKLYIWDNDSKDGMAEAMEEELKDVSFEYELIKHTDNIGFAGGHNALYKQTESKYFLPLNQDMYLTPDCFEQMVAWMDEHEDVAVISPRLMRWDFQKMLAGNDRAAFTGQIDALGLKVFRNRRMIEQYTQYQWADIQKQFLSESIPVFGVSGAFPLYRRTAIDDIAFDDGTFFDESYHSYKEDVDLAYRLRSAGHESYVLLDVVAYHDRSGAGPKKLNDVSALKNKKEHSSWVKYHSYKNHLMTLYKNEYWQNTWLDFPWIKWYELKKFFYFLLFDRTVLKGLGEFIRLYSELRKKKILIKQKRRVSYKELRKWWGKNN
ncbi:glycosyltransferase family 2 protein [Patescibacteria group bacterium]|nr:glycosyltransferase family 2 protein [Patescibacteria group bacterium]MBU1721731.1 glycosyltransferase family 2 protein [Patescibacteria group bacterium]MBU1901430.1 glycosyltransferase family 2 protein [Patescibacteria group bacterium]